jgi:soluble lytic murein transglycosylase
MDRVIYANSLWLQRKWAPALEILLEERDSLPEGLKPFADMLILLGYERTGDGQKAKQAALSFQNGDDWALAPHVAYALGRLFLKDDQPADARKWFEAMAESAKDNGLRKQALEALLRLPEPDPGYALALLEISPLHPEALSMIRRDPGPEDPRTAFPLGYASYFSGDFEDALKQLERVPQDDPRFERAAFFRARALSNLGRGDEALVIWKDLSLKGSRYSQSSIELISRMAQELRGEAIEALVEVSASASGDPAAAALAELANLFARAGDEERASRYEETLLKEYPASRFAAAALWEKGWSAWKKGDIRAADGAWTRALDAGNDPRQESRLLYWAARANERLGDSRSSSTLLERLRKRYPTDYYTSLAFPTDPPKIQDLPTGNPIGEGVELAEWGFVIYARMVMSSSSDTATRSAAARLALWLGDARGAFLDSIPLAYLLARSDPIPRALLEGLYPRARERDVRSASARFGVDPLDIWAIMRRESAFDEEAFSSAGAMGLMQLMPPTARENALMLGEKEGGYFDPAKNILLGTHHFSRLTRIFDRIEFAVAAYNAGQGAVGRWLPLKGPIEEWVEDIPYGETREFVRQVMANRYVYRAMYPEIEKKGDQLE